jgi:hypothetical protein
VRLQWRTAVHPKSLCGTACSATAAIEFKAHGLAAPPKPVPEERNSRIRTTNHRLEYEPHRRLEQEPYRRFSALGPVERGEGEEAGEVVRLEHDGRGIAHQHRRTINGDPLALECKILRLGEGARQKGEAGVAFCLFWPRRPLV